MFSIDDAVLITSGPRRGQTGKVITLPLGSKSKTYTVLVKDRAVLVDVNEITKRPDSEDESGQDKEPGVMTITTPAFGN